MSTICENLRLTVTFIEKLPVKNSSHPLKNQTKSKNAFSQVTLISMEKTTAVEQRSLKKGLSSIGSLWGISASTQLLTKRLSPRVKLVGHISTASIENLHKPSNLNWEHSFLDVCVAHFKVAHLKFLGGGTKMGTSESVCGGPFSYFFGCPT